MYLIYLNLNNFSNLFIELQLKPNQVPFKLVCMWDDLLKKYTSLSAYEIDRGLLKFSAASRAVL